MIYKTSGTLPVDAPDVAFVAHYRYVWARDPRWLYGLRKPGDSLYLPKSTTKPLPKCDQKQARSAA